MLQLGQSLAASGRATAAPAILIPYGVFAAICFVTFFTSRKRPGETPIGLLAERVGDVIRRTLRSRRAAATAAEVEAAA